MILCSIVSVFSAVLTFLFTVDVQEHKVQKQKTIEAVRVSSEAHLIDLQEYETDEEEVKTFTRNFLTTAISMPNFLDLE